MRRGSELLEQASRNADAEGYIGLHWIVMIAYTFCAICERIYVYPSP